MKNILLIAICLLSHAATSQSYGAIKQLELIKDEYQVDDNGNVTYLKIIDSIDLTKDEIFTRVLSFFTYNYSNGESVVQIQDKENGQIIGKGIYMDVFAGVFWTEIYEYDTWHILRVDVKDYKARAILTLSHYRSRNSEGGMPSEVKITEHYPFSQKGSTKNHYAMAFIESHKRVEMTLAALEKAIREGTVGGAAEKKDW